VTASSRILGLTIMLMGLAWSARSDPLPDGIGLFTDLAGTVDRTLATPGALFTVHLLLINPEVCHLTQTFGWSWGCRIEVTDNLHVLDWGSPSGCNSLAPPEFLVTCQGAFPNGSMGVLLTTLLVEVTDSEPGQFYLQEFHFGGVALPPTLTLWNGISAPCVVWLQATSGSWDQPVFLVNPRNTGTVAARTWGGLKILYRLEDP